MDDLCWHMDCAYGPALFELPAPWKRTGIRRDCLSYESGVESRDAYTIRATPYGIARMELTEVGHVPER